MAPTDMPFGGTGTYSAYSRHSKIYTREAAGQPGHGGYAQGYQEQPHKPPQADLTRPRIGVPQILGAVTSLALLAGIGVWSYELIKRDVSGIPVVRATEGPMRVAPQDPGGHQAAHQGLAVNEVAGRGSASGPAAELRLAPTPVDLAPEDGPAAQLQLTSVAPDTPLASARTRSEVVAQLDVGQTDMAPADTETTAARAPAAPLTGDAAIQALADQIAAGVAPLSDLHVPDTPAVQTSLGTAETGAATATPVRAVIDPQARSLRPRMRPAALQHSGGTAAALVPTPPATLEASELPVGTRLVQLGAYDSRAQAEKEWLVFSARFDGFFQDKSRVIERASSGGRIFYRLRAHGFADLADARRFCAALVAEQADCIPVVTR